MSRGVKDTLIELVANICDHPWQNTMHVTDIVDIVECPLHGTHHVDECGHGLTLANEIPP